MPTLYEIFTLRWGAEKDERIAELEAANAEMHKTVTADTKRITELEEADAAWSRLVEADVITQGEQRQRITQLETLLAPFREYVAATDPEAPPTGNGANGAVA